MSFAVEVEVGTIHHNGKAAIPVRTALVEMGHHQGSMPLKTNNNTAEGFFNKIIRQKESNPFDMSIHWMIN